jgi:hypothetical protein
MVSTQQLEESMVKRTHTYRPLKRVRGQSIPLLALMIVVLIGMVALSVDVGL